MAVNQSGIPHHHSGGLMYAYPEGYELLQVRVVVPFDDIYPIIPFHEFSEEGGDLQIFLSGSSGHGVLHIPQDHKPAALLRTGHQGRDHIPGPGDYVEALPLELRLHAYMQVGYDHRVAYKERRQVRQGLGTHLFRHLLRTLGMLSTTSGAVIP
ncbi:hypothetical protein SDC9_160000 [bioreactor metagenome]|uniref:Uncharacterized protein n=1 Tax=bioreactor metagenome TaxID=1076179 RepID=A0A645FE72_9ZZZZ